MAGLRVYRETIKIPISVTWHQELVDDGPGGKDFYMRITPHVNLGGKKDTPLLKKYKGAYWKKTQLELARVNARWSALANKIEKDLTGDAKEIAVKSVRKGQRNTPQALPTKNTTINTAHQEALERSRRQHGVMNEIDKQIDKDIAETYKGQSTEDIMKTYGKSEKDVAFINQMLGHSTAGYDAVMKEYEETKVGDDDDYDY